MKLTKTVKGKEVWFCGCEFAGNPPYPWGFTPHNNYTEDIHQIRRHIDRTFYTCHKNKVFLEEEYKEMKCQTK